MSKIEVDTIAPQSGTQVTLGESGDTITIPAGATFDASSGTLTLADGSVTNAKLAGSITNDKLTNSSITINGSSVSLGGSTTIETGTSWQSSIVTGTTLSAVAGEGYWINTTSNACTITLPASASVGDTIVFVDYARTWGTNAITINQNSLNFQGYSSPNPEYNTSGQSVTIVYSGATQGWIPTVDDDVTLETPQSYSADILVIAGGGGGGYMAAGGGGAGGYRTSTQNLLNGNTYTVTVGDGGSGAPDPATKGSNGSTSSISGSGITTITSAGGGGGGSNDTRDGVSGGSGGGGSRSNGSIGLGNTPSTSPSQGNNGGSGGDNSPYMNGGGGGGAGSVGGTQTNGDGGTPGAGTTSSITGSAVGRAGGGSGGCATGGSSPTGVDGGGTGSTTGSNPADNGTANTGGGGGGGGFTRPSGPGSAGGNGGKGVVIISVPDADYSGTTTGSPTVATGVSGKTVLTFNSSGSYTA